MTTLLFDLDGTLIDPKIGITQSVRFALAKMGRPLAVDENIDWCIGPPLQENFARLLETEAASMIDRAVAFYRERYATTGLFEAQVYEGIPEMLAVLKSQGRTLILATSKPTVFAEAILDHFQLRSFFKAVYGSELDGRRRHKEALLGYLVACEGLAGSRVIMIGDRKFDVLGARANGLIAVGVTYGYGSAAELTAAEPDRLCQSPTDLKQYLMSYPSDNNFSTTSASSG